MEFSIGFDWSNYKKEENFNVIKLWNRKLSKYKVFDSQFNSHSPILCKFSINKTYSGISDHAGVFFHIGLLGYEYMASVYDTRHVEDY